MSDAADDDNNGYVSPHDKCDEEETRSNISEVEGMFNYRCPGAIEQI